MNLSAELERTLEVLDISSLKDVQLLDIGRKVASTSGVAWSPTQVLHLHMAWLNERLQVIDNSEEDILKREITEWCNFLSGCGFTLDYILSEFCAWKYEYVALQPSASRRLNLAYLEIRTLLSPWITGPPTAAPPSDRRLQPVEYGEEVPANRRHEYHGPSGLMHPDRLQTIPSHDVFRQDESDRDNDFQKERPVDDAFKGMHPDRLQMSLANSLPNDWDISDPEHSLPVKTEEGEDSKCFPSYLTGSNCVGYGDKGTATSPAKALQKLEKKAKGKIAASKKNIRKKNRKPNHSNVYLPEVKLERPPQGYICNLCGVPGHYLHMCPTLRNPSQDGRPPPSYVCNTCSERGHWKDACPRRKTAEYNGKNRLDARVDLERRIAEQKQGSAKRERPTRKADRYRPREASPPPRSPARQERSSPRSRSPSQHRSSPGAWRLDGIYCTRGKKRSRDEDEILRPNDTYPSAGKRLGEFSGREKSEGRLSFYDDEPGRGDRVDEETIYDESPPENRTTPEHQESDRMELDLAHKDLNTSSYDVDDFLLSLEAHISALQEPGGELADDETEVGIEACSIKPDPDSDTSYSWKHRDKWANVWIHGEDDETSGTAIPDDSSSPVELGLTNKGTARDPPYSPLVLELFSNLINPWVNKRERMNALALWPGDNDHGMGLTNLQAPDSPAAVYQPFQAMEHPRSIEPS